MRIIIDGYNLLRHDQGLNKLACMDLKRAREALLKRLRSYADARGHSLEVVFDGWGGTSLGQEEERYGRIRVIYSPAGRKADDVIMEMAQRLRDGIVVVTSDREVADFSRSRGCPVVSAGEFEKKIFDALYGGEKGATEEEDVQPGKTKGRSFTPKKKERRSRQALSKL